MRSPWVGNPNRYRRHVDARFAGTATLPAIRRLSLSDLRAVLASGLADFGATRTDIMFLCVVYPVIGLVLGRIFAGHNLIQLLFPLAAGFALVGPLVAVGLNELSRRRERGLSIRWIDMFGVLRSPSIVGIAILGVMLVVIFLLWLQVAELIYAATMGPLPPASFGALLHEVITTRAGWALMVLGIGVGFLFALLVLSITVVSFPLMLDRPAGVNIAIATSLRVMAKNPVVMAAWGLIIAVALAVGTLPLFLGLIVVLPVLGHATWHLYRRAVVT
jgi:uncharacterized membrane protein